ncbi:MAG: LysR family transcriptional regulator [Bryobacteraceae bacterium]
MLFQNSKLFRDIAHHKSISRGAVLSGMSQSAASQHLQELEKKLGVTLVDRSTRPLALTEAGELYDLMCRDVLLRQDEFLTAVEGLKGGVEGKVRVASIYSIGLSEMTRLRGEFGRLYPKARLQVDYHHPARIYAELRADRADLGLVSYPEASRDLAVIPWRNEEMAVAATPYHPLAQSRVLLPSDLAGYDFVAFTEELTIRREIDRFFREHGVDIHIVMQFDSIQVIKEAIALGSGISILPARTFQAEIDDGRLIAIPLLAPELVRPVGIVHRKRKRFGRAVQAFLELLR